MKNKLPIPRDAVSQHTIALGKTRAGKSSKLRLVVENLLDHDEPVCVIDPKGDWWGLKSSADGKHPGYAVIIFGGEHADVPINEHSGAVVAELIATGNRPCIIDLGGWMVGPRTRFFVDFASTLFKLTKGARHLVIDECHNFAPQGRVLDPDAGKMLHWANRLASEGAGKGITLISASQRPQKVHKDYVTSHETLIACRVIHPLDRNAIRDWIDGCADPQIGKDVMTALAGLQRSQAYVWSPEIGFGPKLVDFPLFKTYDSFKPQDARAPKSLKGWASVDLDDVKTRLAVVVEEAKANDPKMLKAEIAALKKRLAARETHHKFVPTFDAQAQGAVWAEAWLNGERTGFSRGVAEIKSAFNGAAAVAYVPGTPSKPTKNVLAAQVAIPQKRTLVIPPSLNRAINKIDPPLQKIVDAIKWWEVMGANAPSHVQVGFIAGYSHKSGTWATYLSRLRSQGLIEGRGDLKLTSEGEAVASLPGVPPTGEALREIVLAKINPPLRKIAEPIFATYPGGLDHAMAGAQSGYSPSSGTWATYLSRLRTLDLIEGRGELKAQGWLFP